ncbi:hypothetical protein Rsub_12686 [Raphidocelis subcapitata]|uniref:C2H2-type domain-containing protein n=1 Tax=Raphidocelis subcapitata TaxID=307507 RepID=A0A2V0PPD0_9CHLO|nr:hypothetical protein Rsub_12686 [Raphidocelis subcapitata]|eukprot:GBF99890.1 hypothetical protein Rsub_12686 [Raphidocelis subcapitata]
MGNAPGKRRVGGNSKTKKWHKQGVRKKFEARHIDQVWEDVRKPPQLVHSNKAGPQGTTSVAEHDEEVPGLGQHYCIPCSRYFSNAGALATHEKTKPHRRRAKLLLASDRPHNQVDAEVASGMGRPDNGPRLRSAGGVADMAE